MTISRLFFMPIFLLVVCSCREDENVIVKSQLIDLHDLITENVIAQDSVIACASGSLKLDEFIIYVFPRQGTTDLRYFETVNEDVDENDYANYQQVKIAEEDIFNGFLKSFTRLSVEEKWVIISFMEDGVLNLSQPIHIQHQTSNTFFTDQVTIDQSVQGSPLFDWTPLANTKDAIYFQVVSDPVNNLLSGTYTFEPQFRYYDLSNVVLNITPMTPPDLVLDQSYGFTLMGVSKDNWVNTFIQADFVTTP